MDKLQELQALKVIVKGGGLVFTGLVISNIITYLYRLFIARYFTPSEYGLFSLGLGIISVLGILSLVGLTTGVTRYIAFYKMRKNKKRLRGVITSPLKIVLSTSIVLAILAIFFSQGIATKLFHNPALTIMLIVLSLSVPFSSLISVFNSIFQGFQKIKYVVYLNNIFSNLLKLTLLAVFSFVGIGILAIPLSWTISIILTFFLSAYLLEKRVYSVLPGCIGSISSMRELLSYSLPLFLGGIMGVIVGWSDTLFLGYFKTSIDVGIYNAALPTANLLLVIPSTFLTLFLPIITGLCATKKFVEIKKIYKTVTRWVFYINFPVFLLMVFFSKQVLNILFGLAYVPGYLALSILSFGFLVHTFFTTSGGILKALGRTEMLLFISIIATILSVFLNVMLIPKYGSAGAAVATSSSFFISAILAGTIVWFYNRMNLLSKGLLKSLCAGVLSIVFINYTARFFFTAFPIYLLVFLSTLFMVLYGILLLLFRGFEREDMEMLRAIEKRFGIKIGFLRKITSRFVS